jgi:hypothetical protein
VTDNGALGPELVGVRAAVDVLELTHALDVVPRLGVLDPAVDVSLPAVVRRERLAQVAAVLLEQVPETLISGS